MMYFTRAISKEEDFDTTWSDINTIAKWSDDNFLKLNPKKCKFIIIHLEYASPVAMDPFCQGEIEEL